MERLIYSVQSTMRSRVVRFQLILQFLGHVAIDYLIVNWNTIMPIVLSMFFGLLLRPHRQMQLIATTSCRQRHRS